MPFVRRAARAAALLSVLMATAEFSKAQAIHDTVAPLLEKEVQPKAVTAYQLKRYLIKNLPKPGATATAELWNAKAETLRKHILEDVVYHGWPREWIDSAPRFEQTEIIETNHGF